MSTIIVGEVDWLRNDYPCEISIGGIEYPSVEHAYQASKFTDASVRAEIAAAESVREARNIGRKYDGIRSDWDEKKISVMETLIRQKFHTDRILGERLAKTGTSDIIMEGYDEYWGTGRSGHGQNMLGSILCDIREDMQLLHGIDGSDYDDDPEPEEEEAPSLRDAILNNPDEELADACQDLLDGAQGMLMLVERKDFDAQAVASYYNVTPAKAADAIEKLNKMISAITSLEDLLSTPSEDDGYNPEWLNSNKNLEEVAADAKSFLAESSQKDVLAPNQSPQFPESHPTDDWLTSFD